MAFVDQLKELGTRAERLYTQLKTEEATKNALIMPFITALGYDVFDPHEVNPELTADVGIKKGEKVDYAIMRDGSPTILFECKGVTADLEKLTPSQLYRYFSVTTARFGVFTNGLHYQFFSDLDALNKMDARPFMEFDIREINETLADSLERFKKDSFDVDAILSTASDLKYKKGIKKILAEERLNPSEEFVKLLVARVYDGKMTKAVKEQFTAIIKRAFNEFIVERVQTRLTSALEQVGDSIDQTAVEETATSDAQNVVTTDEEIEAFYVVKSIVREVVDPGRVFMRDTQSYCGILLDDNNRKPLCRLFLGTGQKRLVLFDAQRQPVRHPIQSVNDIYLHAEALKSTAISYDRAGEMAETPLVSES
jgi:predicted type IV restriction endonuclease